MLLADEYSVSSDPITFSNRPSFDLLIDWSNPSISSFWKIIDGVASSASCSPSPDENLSPRLLIIPTASRMRVLTFRDQSLPADEWARPSRYRLVRLSAGSRTLRPANTPCRAIAPQNARDTFG